MRVELLEDASFQFNKLVRYHYGEESLVVRVDSNIDRHHLT